MAKNDGRGLFWRLREEITRRGPNQEKNAADAILEMRMGAGGPSNFETLSAFRERFTQLTRDHEEVTKAMQGIGDFARACGSSRRRPPWKRRS